MPIINNTDGISESSWHFPSINGKALSQFGKKTASIRPDHAEKLTMCKIFLLILLTIFELLRRAKIDYNADEYQLKNLSWNILELCTM